MLREMKIVLIQKIGRGIFHRRPVFPITESSLTHYPYMVDFVSWKKSSFTWWRRTEERDDDGRMSNDGENKEERKCPSNFVTKVFGVNSKILIIMLLRKNVTIGSTQSEP